MRIHHVALRTADLPRLERFYAGVLGLAMSRRDDARGSVWLLAGDAVVMLERAAEGEARLLPPQPRADPISSPLPMDLLAFAVPDKEAWRARLEDAGVRVEAETSHTLYVRDPDGRRIGLSTYPVSAVGPTP
ncbi:MAG: VOC family protein [Myxococcota bacterium]|nr:VOC family protein [Myxococcota bacterium]